MASSCVLVLQLDVEPRRVGSPKAVLFWKFLSGEGVFPIDQELLQDLKTDREWSIHATTWTMAVRPFGARTGQGGGLRSLDMTVIKKKRKKAGYMLR